MESEQDVTLAVATVLKVPQALRLLHPVLRRHPKVVAAACVRDSKLIETVESRDALMAVLRALPRVRVASVYKRAMQCATTYASDEVTRCALRCSPAVLAYAPEGFKDDVEIAREAVAGDPSMFRHVSARLRQSKAFLLDLVAQPNHRILFQHASHALRNDRAVVCAALRTAICPSDVYRAATDAVRADRDVLLVALRRQKELRFTAFDKNAYAYAADALKQDRAFAFEAMACCALSTYRSLGSMLRVDVEVVLCALDHGLSVHEIARGVVVDDAKMRTIVARHGKALFATPSSLPLRDDPEVIAQAVRTCGAVLSLAPAHMRKEYAIVARAVSQDGTALQYATDELCRDAAIVTCAVGQTGNALPFVHPEFWDDLEIVALAARTAPCAVVKYVHVDLVGAPRTCLAMLHARDVSRATMCKELERVFPLLASVGDLEEVHKCSDLVAELASKVPSDWADVLDAAEAFVARLHAPDGRVAHAYKRSYAEAFD